MTTQASCRARRQITEVGLIYQKLNEALALLDASCDRCGECCDFASYGHRLFCSSLELEYLIENVGTNVVAQGFGPGTEALTKAPDEPGKWDIGPDPACPWLAESGCLVYPYRMLGCRTFFCNTRHKQERQDIHERFLSELKRRSDEVGIPWIYGPLNQVMRKLAPEILHRGQLI